MKIYCCTCDTKVEARLTHGSEVYPHCPDLYKLPFWKCDKCKNFVGCHHKTKNKTRPLGCIPDVKIKNARKHIHALLDPAWKNSAEPKEERKYLYLQISMHLGYEFHTAEIRDIEEARRIYKVIKKVLKAEGA